MTHLTIIGAGGHGKVTAEIAEAVGYDQVRFVDQLWPEKSNIGKWAVVAREPGKADAACFCAIGNNAMRARLFDRFSLDKGPTLTHPSAIVSPSATVGSGTLIVAGCIVNADASIGIGVILNTACCVDHDCRIGDFAHISPGAKLAGGVSVGTGSWIGIGAVIREGVTIGRNAMVSAGAVVIDDVDDDQTVMGVPAKLARRTV